MFNGSYRKRGSVSELSLEALDNPKNLGSPDQLNDHLNSALQDSSNSFDTLELNHLDKPRHESDFSLIKTVSLSSKATQTEAEFISFRHKSISPELQTVVEWSNLEVEITVKGETKKILSNISGQTSNLEILAILGEYALWFTFG